MAPLEFVGRVVSNAMNKSILVMVRRWHLHPKLNHVYSSRRKFMAHDEEEVCRVGDTVKIRECRPLSKRKNFTLLEVIHKDPNSPEGKVSVKYLKVK